MRIKAAVIPGQVGVCGGLEAFLGFAPAKLLHSASFADVLDEDTGRGYQRPRNRSHSLDFKRYIARQGSSTVPLTFNLRKEMADAWELRRQSNGRASLLIRPGVRCLAQVDCQHRLGEMSDSDVPLAFMAFIGLDLRAEMGLFVIINSKAKGLSSSLTDFHESTLIDDLAAEAPHLYISRKLNEDRRSPWFRLIRYGGETTSGLKRRTSLRMMQKSVSRFLAQMQSGDGLGIEEEYALILSFWRSVARVFPNEWHNHRRHLLTKGVGLYAMTLLLADIVNAADGQALDEDFFVSRLEPLKGTIDWSSKGMFSEAGGRKGALEVYDRLREFVQP